MDKKRSNKTVALFGGSFDPPHLGHQQLIKKALAAKIVDEIWLIPVFLPPLKTNKEDNFSAIASADDRLRMCQLIKNIIPGIKGPKFRELKVPVRVLDIEIKRKGKSYTIDTVRELKKRYPGYIFYFLIGSDWVRDLSKWHRIEELYKAIEFVVLPRTEVSSSGIRERIKKNLSIIDLVPKEVEQYIKGHGLYK